MPRNQFFHHFIGTAIDSLGPGHRPYLGHRILLHEPLPAAKLDALVQHLAIAAFSTVSSFRMCSEMHSSRNARAIMVLVWLSTNLNRVFWNCVSGTPKASRSLHNRRSSVQPPLPLRQRRHRRWPDVLGAIAPSSDRSLGLRCRPRCSLAGSRYCRRKVRMYRPLKP